MAKKQDFGQLNEVSRSAKRAASTAELCEACDAVGDEQALGQQHIINETAQCYAQRYLPFF